MRIVISLLLLIAMLGWSIGCIDEDVLTGDADAPSIISVEPDSGEPGDTITITGEQFQNINTDSVLINGSPSRLISLTPTTIEFTVPDTATTGPVSVITPLGFAVGPDFTVLEVTTPMVIAIDSIRPEAVFRGDSIQIYGQNFDMLAANFSVLLNNLELNKSRESNGLIKVRVSDNGNTGPIRLVNGTDTIQGPILAILDDPSIAIISAVPNQGEIGDQITITGQNFDLLDPGYQLFFNNSQAMSSVISSGQIQTTVPSNATSGSIRIDNDGDVINGPFFTVNLAPIIQSISPMAGPIGTVVTITGENFGTDDTNVEVTFNDVIANVSSINDNQIVVTVPDNATTGNVAIEIISSGLSAEGPVFTVEVPGPVINGISPNAGPVGTLVTITGENFGTESTETEVTFNGTVASINSITDTQIEVNVPSGATTGNVGVRSLVTGLSDTGPVFTVQVINPVISNISPNVGPVGTQVTISGQNFGTEASQVEVGFNGEQATINSITNVQIIATVPANATTGPVSVTLLNFGTSTTGPVFTVENDCPVITSISPTSGPVGTQVTIIGQNFGFTFVDAEVRLNGLLIDPNSVDDDRIVFTVPFNGSTGIVSVTSTSNNKTANGPIFTVEVPDVQVSSIGGPNDGISRPLQIIGIGNGNFLFSDTQSHQIKRIDENGNVTVFAGTGQAGFFNGKTTEAQFNAPGGLARDAQGNIYVADVNNQVIRLINTSQVVSTLAGIGQAGFMDGLALQVAQFDQPLDVAIDGNDLYISDLNNHAIRKLDLQTGMVTTVAGNGTSGTNDGFRSTSRLNSPIGISIDNNGDLLIADALNHRIRRLATGGNFLSTITGFAGTGFIDGTRSTARFSIPYDVHMDSQGVIYVADGNNHSIRKIFGDAITTIAGTGVAGLQDGQGNQAQFNFPTGFYIAADNELWICDFNNDSIRKIDINP